MSISLDLRSPLTQQWIKTAGLFYVATSASIWDRDAKKLADALSACGVPIKDVSEERYTPPNPEEVKRANTELDEKLLGLDYGPDFERFPELRLIFELYGNSWSATRKAIVNNHELAHEFTYNGSSTTLSYGSPLRERETRKALILKGSHLELKLLNGQFDGGVVQGGYRRVGDTGITGIAEITGPFGERDGMKSKIERVLAEHYRN